MKVEDILKRLRLEFIFMWLLAILLATAYETGLLTEGSCTGNATVSYLIETAAILLTLVVIPVTLKISGKFMHGRMTGKERSLKTRTLLRWHEIQIFLLTIVIITDISVYYATMESLGILCAAVGLVASFLCVPTRTKLENYLSNPQADQQ